MKKNLFLLTLLPVLVIGLSLVIPVRFGLAQNGLISFLTSDTTWTKDNSPYKLTAPVVVSTGVTLTIDPGVEVNLSGCYIFVNGTLHAVGTASDKIQISGGKITFGDNDQVGSNSIFENAVIDLVITNSKALKLNKNTINAEISVGANSEVLDNNIVGNFVAGTNTAVSNNRISGNVRLCDECTFSANTVTGDIFADKSVKILNNNINGSKHYQVFGGYVHTTAVTVGSSSEIFNNTISGGIIASSSTISNNVISGGTPSTDLGGRGSDSTSAVTVSGDSFITSNVIFSTTGGYGVLIKEGYTHVSGNTIKKSIRVAGDALIENNLITDSGTGIQIGRIYIDAFYEIDHGYGDSIIRNNIIANNSVGIGSGYRGGTATIEHNLISNNGDGISVCSQVSILNNTITDSTTAIKLRTSSVTLAYNNIVNYTEYSVHFASVSASVDLIQNWWGTTDTQAINLTIRDFKYNINVGKANFLPVLTQPNDQAPSTSFSVQLPSLADTPNVPEFPLWIILPFLLVTTAVTIMINRKLNNRQKQ